MSPDTDPPIFRPVDAESMERILPFLQLHKERSCDFSYGGLLMWIEMFEYEYAIHNDTLFIKGHTPTDGDHTARRTAFSMPLGNRPLQESVETLQAWCRSRKIPLTFSSVTPEVAEQLKKLGAKQVHELPAWEDYIYDAASLASLAGKKLSKKRNHVNQFKNLYPDWEFSFMTPADVEEIYQVVNSAIAREASQTEEARTERALANKLLQQIALGNPHLTGGILRAGGNIVAYTIGDINGDTLHIHVEKGERSVAGSFEMINHCFAKVMLEKHPEITHINREDDAGDPGLRLAKQSYHPLYLLKKYNVIF